MCRFGVFVVFIALSATGPAYSQAPVYDAMIQKSFAEVRGGRSTIFPVTGLLRQNARLRVLREEGGWLAIQPPEGSSSWVLERVLDKQPTVGRRDIFTVLADDSPVLLGAADNPAPFPNEVTKLRRGTLVTVLGEKATSDAMGEKTTWWRIQPSPGEVRWVAKDAISPTSAYAATTAAPPLNARPVPALWTQAEQAERAGNFAQAIIWYRQVASDLSRTGTDSELAMRAYNRAEQLSKRQTPATYVSRPSSPAATPSSTIPAATWPAGVMMTSGPGTLRRSAIQIEGQTAFVLEDARGYPRVYVIAQPGLNLDPFVNRQVELFGPMNNRSDLAIGGYMTVGKLHLLR